MHKIGIFVGEKGNWSFFSDIFKNLDTVYQTKVFKERVFKTPLLYGRLNRWAYQNGIQKILQWNDLSFFEWASELLVPASHMPKYAPIITRLHSYEIYAWAPKINWNLVDKVILVCKAMADKFVNYYPDCIDKTVVINNGVNLEKFSIFKRNFDEFNIGMICSIIPRKRVYEIVMLTYRLIEAGYHPHLHISGERWNRPDYDEYYVALLALISKLGLQENVTLYGRIDNAPEWLRKIDIFISNSYWEGQQVALLEAMASGCYCLSHCWSGVEEVLPEENIFLLEDELFKKMIEYYHLPVGDKENYSLKMRSIAEEKFDIVQTKNQIMEVIEATM